jgi:cupin 2 domain-containing protein
VAVEAKLFGNIFEKLPVTEQESFETLFSKAGVKIERIVSRGQRSAEDFWYEQVRDEWVIVLKGAATLSWEGEADTQMGVGDYVFIPALRRHRVAWTDPQAETIWLAVHCD